MEIQESNAKYLISTSSRLLYLYLHFTAVFWIKSKAQDSGWLQFPNRCFMRKDSTFLYEHLLYNITSNSWNLKWLCESILADRQEVTGINELLQLISQENFLTQLKECIQITGNLNYNHCPMGKIN